MARAVALVSTGLDSLLAARIVAAQGVAVTGLHCSFRFGFTSGPDRKALIRRQLAEAGIPLETADVTEPFMDVIRRPAHGFGSAVNPCIDCHLFMLVRARERMEAEGADFVVTGEVVGQRPMSQNLPTLHRLEKLSGLKGRLLRPLSAKRLPPTEAEERGWVDREKLYGIAGRGRRDQEALAREFGLTEYAQPAGGCILTDPFFAVRVRALIRSRGQQNLTADDMMLCRFGRHFWIDGRVWVVVGRNESDNAGLAPFRKGRTALEAVGVEGPLVVAEGVSGPGDLAAAAGLCARYVSKRRGNAVTVAYEGPDGSGTLSAEPPDPALLSAWAVQDR